jgi:hypothetical protein
MPENALKIYGLLLLFKDSKIYVYTLILYLYYTPYCYCAISVDFFHFDFYDFYYNGHVLSRILISQQSKNSILQKAENHFLGHCFERSGGVAPTGVHC